MIAPDQKNNSLVSSRPTNAQDHFRILLIEDNTDYAELTVRRLFWESQGTLDIDQAHTLETALKKIESKEYSLAIVDLQLPDSKGLETFKRIFEKNLSLPVIVLTGLDEEKIAIEAVSLGAQDYLIKSQINYSTLLRSIRYAIARSRILTEWRNAWQDQYYLATHDPLTNLPNRALFQDRLSQAIHQAKRHQFMLSVFFIDVDRFKQINDTLGHAAGDIVLKEVAQRLKSCIRSGDTLARLGGDEFGILIYKMTQESDAVGVLERMKKSFEKTIEVNDQPIYVTLSVGVSVFPGDSQDSFGLLSHADLEMYEAKKQGGNRFSGLNS